jgi:hypothetical protein
MLCRDRSLMVLLVNRYLKPSENDAANLLRCHFLPTLT